MTSGAPSAGMRGTYNVSLGARNNNANEAVAKRTNQAGNNNNNIKAKNFNAMSPSPTGFSEQTTAIPTFQRQSSGDRYNPSLS